ncbi:MAG TPA: M48 family metallopeptidase [Gemmatimonadota bacterium]|nr:M48 family metallopeptidase [Gemmatimonadota bacterium]
MTSRGLYGEIEANRRRSWALLGGIVFVLVAMGAAFGIVATEDLAGGIFGAIVAFAFGVFLFITTWFGGARMTLAASGARRADRERDRVLVNVVEEMAIASGLSPPEVWIIEDTAPNAFATGRDPRHAAVAVTSGLYEKLDRDELQGVIAHELSHVRNYDIRYTTLVAVTVGAIALLADFAIRHLRWGGGPRRSRNQKAGAALILLALVVAILAPLSAQLLQAASSRRRETLADLGGAELTRYPEALARALLKIDADPEVLEAANRATAPLYIVNPIKSFEARAAGLLRTHPPTEERVRLLRSLVLLAGS